MLIVPHDLYCHQHTYVIVSLCVRKYVVVRSKNAYWYKKILVLSGQMCCEWYSWRWHLSKHSHVCQHICSLQICLPEWCRPQWRPLWQLLRWLWAGTAGTSRCYRRHFVPTSPPWRCCWSCHQSGWCQMPLWPHLSPQYPDTDWGRVRRRRDSQHDSCEHWSIQIILKCYCLSIVLSCLQGQPLCCE